MYCLSKLRDSIRSHKKCTSTSCGIAQADAYSNLENPSDMPETWDVDFGTDLLNLKSR